MMFLFTMCTILHTVRRYPSQLSNVSRLVTFLPLSDHNSHWPWGWPSNLPWPTIMVINWHILPKPLEIFLSQSQPPCCTNDENRLTSLYRSHGSSKAAASTGSRLEWSTSHSQLEALSPGIPANPQEDLPCWPQHHFQLNIAVLFHITCCLTGW